MLISDAQWEKILDCQGYSSISCAQKKADVVDCRMFSVLLLLDLKKDGLYFEGKSENAREQS